MTLVRSEGRSGKGAGKKDEKGKKNSLREVDLPKKSDAGTSGSGSVRSASATVAPAAASTPKGGVSGSSLQPKPTIVTTSIGTGSVRSASGNAVATDTNTENLGGNSPWLLDPDGEKVFTLAGFPSHKQTLKEDLIKKIRELGGEVIETEEWDPKVTHVVTFVDNQKEGLSEKVSSIDPKIMFASKLRYRRLWELSRRAGGC